MKKEQEGFLNFSNLLELVSRRDPQTALDNPMSYGEILSAINYLKEVKGVPVVDEYYTEEDFPMREYTVDDLYKGDYVAVYYLDLNGISGLCVQFKFVQVDTFALIRLLISSDGGITIDHDPKSHIPDDLVESVDIFSGSTTPSSALY